MYVEHNYSLENISCSFMFPPDCNNLQMDVIRVKDFSRMAGLVKSSSSVTASCQNFYGMKMVKMTLEVDEAGLSTREYYTHLCTWTHLYTLVYYRCRSVRLCAYMNKQIYVVIYTCFNTQLLTYVISCKSYCAPQRGRTSKSLYSNVLVAMLWHKQCDIAVELVERCLYKVKKKQTNVNDRSKN